METTHLASKKKPFIYKDTHLIKPEELEGHDIRSGERILFKTINSSVSEVAVMGLEDPYWVERVHAVIPLKKGLTAVEKEIIECCKERLARYNAPKSVDFLDELPKNPHGKISKRSIRRAYRQKYSNHSGGDDGKRTLKVLRPVQGI